MALGTEVGLSAGHIVLDGNPAAPPLKQGRAPQISINEFCILADFNLPTKILSETVTGR